MIKRSVRIAPDVTETPLASKEFGDSIRLADASYSDTRNLSAKYAPGEESKMKRRSSVGSAASAGVFSVDEDRAGSKRLNLRRLWRRLYGKPAFAGIFLISVEMLCATIIAVAIP
eukprot:5268325-Pleurochrysis_carterae.AAC.1